MAEDRVRAVEPVDGVAPPADPHGPDPRRRARAAGSPPAQLAAVPDLRRRTASRPAPSTGRPVRRRPRLDARRHRSRHGPAHRHGLADAEPGSAPELPSPSPAAARRTAVTPRHRQMSPSEGLPTTSRVLSRIARFGSGRGATTSPVLEPLLRTVRQRHPKADLALIERAYEVAAEQRTPGRSARAATRTSPTRSRSPRSSPSSA